MEWVPHYVFRRLVTRHRGDYKTYRLSCWDQFLCLAFAQLTYRESLRDIEVCLRSRSSQLYHLGIRMLNPIIRGWVNYHRHVAASDTFGKVDNHLWQSLWHWAKHRHSEKPRRVSEIARELVPELWLRPNDDLVGKVKAAHQHLDTLNEFWWLSRWINPFKSQANYHMHADSGLDVDWRLTWDFGQSSISVNLEAKRRRDVLRSGGEPINPKEIFEAALFDKKGRCKFFPSKPDEINVLALTLIGEIDHEVQYHAENWLKTRKDIDAIALFSRFSTRKTGFDLHVQRKQDLLSQVLNRDLHDKNKYLHSLIQRPLPCTSLLISAM